MNRALPTRGYRLPFLRVNGPTARLGLALATLACATLMGCGARAADATNEPRDARPLPDLLGMVADDADASLEAKVDAITRSPYFELVASSLRDATEPGARAESEWLLDLAGRTDHLVAVAWLMPDGTLETLVLLRGRYGEEDVRRMTAGERGLHEERRPSVRAFVRGERALALVGLHTIAVGPTPRLRAAIARLDAPAPPRSAEDAAAPLSARQAHSTSELAVFVRVTDRVARLLSEMVETRGAGELRSLALDADLGRGLRLRVELATESADAASRLLPIVEARAAALVDSALVDVLGLAPSLRGARAESVGASVVASAFVDDATLRSAIAAAWELAIELARPSP